MSPYYRNIVTSKTNKTGHFCNFFGPAKVESRIIWGLVAYSRMSRRSRPEDQIQRAVFQHIKLRGVPGLVAIHPANGGFRKPVEAKILAGLGVTKGAPDILAWHAGKAFALELKSEQGRATEAQLEMLARLDAQGVYTCVAVGLDRALAVLEAWGLLRGSVQ
jgi:hypothetical protein